MANPMVYDFRRTLTSKMMLLVFVAFILIGALVVFANASSGVQIQGVARVNTPLWYYYTGSGYQFLGYSYDLYGNPIAGVNYSVTAYVGSTTQTVGALTNSSGYASFSLKVPGTSGVGVAGTVTLPGSIANEQNGGQPMTFQNQLSKECGNCGGGYTSQSFQGTFNFFTDPTTNSTSLLVTELGSGGSVPSNWRVYYEFTSEVPSPQFTQNLSESQMKLLGSLSGVHATFPVPGIPGGAQDMVLAVFTSNGNEADAGVVTVQQLSNSCKGCSAFQLWGYTTAKGFGFLGYSADASLAPLPGTSYNITLSVGPKTYTAYGVTNSSGLVAIQVPAPVSDGAGGGASVSFPSQTGGEPMLVQFQLPAYSNQAQAGFQQIFSDSQGYIINHANQTQLEADIIQTGPNGTAPTGSAVYYEYSPTVLSQKSLQSLNETQMHLLAPLVSVQTIVPMPPSPPSGTKTLVTAVFGSSGGLESVTAGSPPQMSTASPSLRVATVLLPDILIVLPFVGLMAAVIAYGNERASGVLESILARPVSRRGLAASRYLSVILALGIASVVTVLVVAELAAIELHVPVGVTYELGLILGVFVESSAFAGIVFVLSRVFKSLGKIIGGVLVIYFVTDLLPLFFQTIPTVYLLVDPARYAYVILSYLSSFELFGPNSPVYFSPAAAGLTSLTLAGAAVLWFAVPLGAFLFLSIKRD